jgi:hypothetical protein
MEKMKTNIMVFFLLLVGISASAQDFYQQEITDDIFSRIEGKSFKANCTTPREDLRYLRVLHYNNDREILKGELICHKDIAEDLLAIFQELYKAAYPIERMVLIDEYDADDEASMRANNTSAFNFRYASGMKRLSSHSTGMAIDINPLYNPLVKHREGQTRVFPTTAAAYMDRTKYFPYKIEKGDLCYRLFKKYGFSWGGDWKSSKDYQHFEKR